MVKWTFLTDSREKADLKKIVELGQFPNQYETGLPYGDFAVREDESFTYLAGIEHKRVGDLCQSIQSQRIFEQVRNMEKHYPVRWLFVSGSLQDHIERLQGMNMQLNTNVVYGTLASIAVRNKFHIMWLNNIAEVVDVAYRICEKIAEGKYEMGASLKKAENFNPVNALMMIPGVSRDKAKALMKHYGNMFTIASATLNDLQSVNGIGQATAENIYKFFNLDQSGW